MCGPRPANCTSAYKSDHEPKPLAELGVASSPRQLEYPNKWSSHASQISGFSDPARDVGDADDGAGARHRARRARRRGGRANTTPVRSARWSAQRVGAVGGTVGGILGVEDRPRFREYVVRERQPSYRYDNDFRVGAMLPESGVTYYDVPAEYHVQGYRYAYVNDHAVLVDPRTHRIVQIID